MALGTFFLREIRNGLFAKRPHTRRQLRRSGITITTLLNQAVFRRARLPYDPAGVYGSQAITNAGFKFTEVLTQDGTGVDANVTISAFNARRILFTTGPTSLSASANLYLAVFYDQEGNTDSPVDVDSLSVTQASPAPPVLVGDFNRDGHVDAKDIQSLQLALTNLSSYESTYSVSPTDFPTFSDVDGDGKVHKCRPSSLLTLLKSGGGSANFVPEPSAMILMVLGLIGIVGANGRRQFKLAP